VSVTQIEATSSIDEERLAQTLVEEGALDPPSLKRALRLQSDGGGALTDLLLQLGMVSEKDLARALAEQLGLEVVSSGAYPDTPVTDDPIAPEFLRGAGAVPLALDDTGVRVAMTDPTDAYTRQALSMALGMSVVPVLGTASDINAAIARLYGDGSGQMEEITQDYGGDEGDAGDIQQLKDLASEAPVIRVVNLIFSRALSLRASDIHIEPFESRLSVRYRVDGVLRESEAPPVRSTAAVISRIKVLANLNIAERRLPQDGRIKLRVEGRDIDMRISTVPTLHGESVVMRILDKGSLPLDFAALGFDGHSLSALRTMLAAPHGILLVTGPTGSGKTTTLYAALSVLNTPNRKILTVEDPVEYQLDGINQIQVKPQIGLDFAGALRSILRQDPDVIMVGEMRDLETAKIAVQAALTGHKVFSTLHTNDAASSVTRLLDMGVEDYLVTSTVTGIIAQRLVRTLCPHCRQSYSPPSELVDELGLARLADAAAPLLLYRAVGCDACEGVGYHGRTTVMETMLMDDTLARAVLGSSDASTLRTVARERGAMSMRENGLRKALQGLTTVEEVARATREA
jgi:general secretion pathway protein E